MVNNNHYTNISENEMNHIFHSLADPTRRQILKRLTSDVLTVSEIAKPYTISLPAISKHIKILEQANLIRKEQHGREHSIHLQHETFRSAEHYIAFYTKFWNKKLDGLEKFLEKGGADER